MSISIKRINVIIDERFKPDQNNDIIVNHFKIPNNGYPVWKQIKTQLPAEYKKIVDQIFDELHPF